MIQADNLFLKSKMIKNGETSNSIKIKFDQNEEIIWGFYIWEQVVLGHKWGRV